jgi:histidyl-tRNA synthetase
VLDTKREEDQKVVAGAPRVLEHLTPEADARFERVQRGLRALGIAFEVDARLVRGLDYYNHTLFEFPADALDAAQNAIGGGGRYNGLVEALGGPVGTGGVGFGAGIERILLACDAEGVFAGPGSGIDVFVVDTTGGGEALVVAAELREVGLGADRAFDQRSMKSQMKAADRSGAALAVIIGADEQAARTATLRPLRGDGEQVTVARAELVQTVRRWLSR